MSEIQNYLKDSGQFSSSSSLKKKKSAIYFVIQSENQAQEYEVEDSIHESMVRSASLSSTHVLNPLNINNMANQKRSKEGLGDNHIVMNTLKTKKNLDLQKEKIRQEIRKVNCECSALESLIEEVSRKQAELIVEKHRLLRNRKNNKMEVEFACVQQQITTKKEKPKQKKEKKK